MAEFSLHGPNHPRVMQLAGHPLPQALAICLFGFGVLCLFFFLFFISFPGWGLLPVIKALRQNVWALPISPVTPRCSVWRGDTGPTSAPQRYHPATGAWEGQAAEMSAGSAACRAAFLRVSSPFEKGSAG